MSAEGENNVNDSTSEQASEENSPELETAHEANLNDGEDTFDEVSINDQKQRSFGEDGEEEDAEEYNDDDDEYDDEEGKTPRPVSQCPMKLKFMQMMVMRTRTRIFPQSSMSYGE